MDSAMLLDQKLACPHASQLHPDIVGHVETLKRLATAMHEFGGHHLYSCLSWAEDKSGLAALDVLTKHGEGIYSFPFLHPDYCAQLREQADSMRFKVNDAETPETQIPEIFLRERLPVLYASLRTLFSQLVIPLSEVVFRMKPATLDSVQFARYTPENTAHGHWHTDEDSEVTAVVALSSDHEGGGTSAAPPGLGRPVFVPTLPVGHAMFFLGRTTQHRGERVTAGKRDLLVFWSNT
jgi:hypothetical protein